MTVTCNKRLWHSSFCPVHVFFSCWLFNSAQWIIFFFFLGLCKQQIIESHTEIKFTLLSNKKNRQVHNFMSNLSSCLSLSLTILMVSCLQIMIKNSNKTPTKSFLGFFVGFKWDVVKSCLVTCLACCKYKVNRFCHHRHCSRWHHHILLKNSWWWERWTCRQVTLRVY
jgi:hypothetical protein